MKIMHRGEKGFTLIELLIVIVILGVLAAVATLAVTQFIGKGNVEAARSEKATAEVAIEAALADAALVGHGVFDVQQDWDGTLGTSPTVAAGAGHPDDITAQQYLRSQNGFKATYTVEIDGDIINGVAGGAGGDWTKVAWDNAQDNWIKGT